MTIGSPAGDSVETPPTELRIPAARRSATGDGCRLAVSQRLAYGLTFVHPVARLAWPEHEPAADAWRPPTAVASFTRRTGRVRVRRQSAGTAEHARMLLARARRLWGGWWLLPGGVPVAYVCIVALAGHASVVLTLLALGACVLAYTGEASKRLYVFLLPCLLVAFGYDAQRYPRAWFVGPERVLGCRLRRWDLALFRAGPDTTWPDWFAVHHTPVLDLVCAVPYFAFIYVVVVYAFVLYVVDRPRSSWLLWTFAVGNLIAFVCWTVIPAAPPWYVRTHGCVTDLCAAPSAAALAFAAVYLEHHWVIDALAGWIVAIVSAALAKRLVGHFATFGSSVPPTPDKAVEP